MQTIGERVQTRRHELGLSLAELGEALGGVSRQAVHQLEQVDDIRFRRAQELAQILQCRVVWLLTGTGPVTGRGEAS